MGDAFHEAAIPCKHISKVINDLMVLAVELRRKGFLCHCHAHGVCQALTQWTGGGLNARRIAVFGMTRRR